MNCFLGAGRVSFSPIGQPPVWRHIGNVMTMDIGVELETHRAKDARKGVWLTRNVFVDDARVNVSLSFSEASVANLLEVLMGEPRANGLSIAYKARESVAIKYEGISLEDNRAVLVELWEVRFTDLGTVPLIADEIAEFVLEGEACFSTDRDDAVLGHTGKFVFT
jgi:hypothetical protein